MRELNGTVKDECEDPKEYIDSGLEFLDRLIKERSGKSHVSIFPRCVAKSSANDLKKKLTT